MRLVLALLLMCFVEAAGIAHAADDVSRIRSLGTVEPRGFGHFLGDVIKRQVVIVLAPGAELEQGTLPRPGPVNYWLELHDIAVSEEAVSDGTRVRISLTYQAFYSALDPRKLEIPALTLTVADAEGSEQAEVPPFHFVMSPLREVFPGKESDPKGIVLRPDAPPHFMSTAGPRTAVVIALPVALAALVALALHYAWWPFHRRPSRPFTEAARFLRTHAAALDGEGGYRAALLKLHRAFDRAAGRRVLPDDLPAFLATHPQFAPLSDDIKRLFVSSRTAFYANDIASARSQMPLGELTDLGSRLGAAERSAP